MAQTKEGAVKSVMTNIEKYGEDYYSRIGKLGGSAPYKGLKGFAANKELASMAGRVGGKKSRRS